MTTAIQQPPRRRYNPNAIRRRVRHLNDGNTAAAAFITKSFTRHDFDEHIIHIDPDHCSGHCTCEDATFRRHEQNINFPETCCKHVVRAVSIMEREGSLEPLEKRVEQTINSIACFSVEPQGAQFAVVFRFPDRICTSIEAFDVYEQATYHAERLATRNADGLYTELGWANVSESDRTAILAALGLRRTDINDPATRARILAMANDF